MSDAKEAYEIENELINAELVKLREINAELLAACEANHEFQTGSHSSVEEILRLAEKCMTLTSSAIAKARAALPSSNSSEAGGVR